MEEAQSIKEGSLIKIRRMKVNVCDKALVSRTLNRGSNVLSLQVSTLTTKLSLFLRWLKSILGRHKFRGF